MTIQIANKPPNTLELPKRPRLQTHLAAPTLHRPKQLHNASESQLQGPSENEGILELATGLPDEGGVRDTHRYQQKPAVALLSDYDYLLQALFAEQARVATQHLEAHRTNSDAKPPLTVLARLKAIWERLLPHRSLRLFEMGIEVRTANEPEDQGYPGSGMSDGERVIFYLIGQCLLAPAGSVIIVDEPELHIHKAILPQLWDAIEAERKDCSFVYITHDLDFVVARPSASKLVVRSYNRLGQWEIEPLPTGTELPDRLVSELVGSRQPVLFVEGERGSVDATIYRGVYSDFLIQPIGSCESVIHAVASFRRNASLHRIGMVSGCIDADARDPEEIRFLGSQSVHVLPVAEIENALLLPEAFICVAKALHFTEDEAREHLNTLTDKVLTQATNGLESASVRFAVRRLDFELKKLGPTARTASDLKRLFKESLGQIDPESLAESYRSRLTTAISSRDLAGVLALYDNKGLLSEAAACLGVKGREGLVEFVGRVLAGESGRSLLAALRSALPSISG
jgi:hypothetical protein